MVGKWGSEKAARLKPIDVTANGKTVRVLVKDRMPKLRYITNGARIDLNPDAVRALGLEPPILIDASWEWVET